MEGGWSCPLGTGVRGASFANVGVGPASAAAGVVCARSTRETMGMLRGIYAGDAGKCAREEVAVHRWWSSRQG